MWQSKVLSRYLCSLESSSSQLISVHPHIPLRQAQSRPASRYLQGVAIQIQPTRKAGRWTIPSPLPNSHISNSELWGLNPLWLGLHSVILALIMSHSTLSCPTKCPGSRSVGLGSQHPGVTFRASLCHCLQSCAPSLCTLNLEPAPLGLGRFLFPLLYRSCKDLCHPQNCTVCVFSWQMEPWIWVLGEIRHWKWVADFQVPASQASAAGAWLMCLERDLNLSIYLVMNFWPWAEDLIWFLDKIASVFCDWCWSLSNHFLPYSLCHSALTYCFSRKIFAFLNICLKFLPPTVFKWESFHLFEGIWSRILTISCEVQGAN